MATEQAYNGRAIIENTFSGIKITIPAKRTYFQIFFFIIWLGGWLFGGLFAANAFSKIDNEATKNFLILWLCGWSFGVFYALTILTWLLFGKEVISIDKGLLTIQKKGYVFAKTKLYNVADISALGLVENKTTLISVKRKNNPLPIRQNGKIHFSYGAISVRFGFGITKPEAEHIVSLLKEKF
jgi:hypothetical protein